MACTFHSALTVPANMRDTTADASPISGSITVPSGLTNPGLAIAIVYERDTSQDVTAVTVGGNAATFVAVQDTATSTTEERIEWWVIASPPTGAQTLSLTTGDSGNDIAVFAIMVEGMDQSTMFGATVEADETAENDESISAALTTTAADSLVLCVVSDTRALHGPVTAVVGSGVVTADEVTLATSTAGMVAWCGYVEATTAAAYTIGATLTDNAASDVLRLLAIELLAATGGAAGVGPIIGGRLLTGLVNGGRLVA